MILSYFTLTVLETFSSIHHCPASLGDMAPSRLTSTMVLIHNGFNSFHKNRFKISYTFDDGNGIKEKKEENAITFKSAI